MPTPRYDFSIFRASGVRRERLNGSVYRFWTSYAIAAELGERLSGNVDFLDVGGRDGGTLDLLENLKLSGSYTCIDLEPTLERGQRGGWEVNAHACDYRTFRPERLYDAVLFENALEFAGDYSRDLAWVAPALKPDGFVLATCVSPDTRVLYHRFVEQGGSHLRTAQELLAAFAPIGLRVERLYPVVGVVGRSAQYLLQSMLGPVIGGAWNRTLGRLSPGLRDYNPVLAFNRLINIATVPADYLFRTRPVGHVMVLRKSQSVQ